MTKSTNYIPYIARTSALTTNYLSYIARTSASTTKEVITRQTRGPNTSLPS